MKTRLSKLADLLGSGLIVGLSTVALTATQGESRVVNGSGNHVRFVITDSDSHFLPINWTSTSYHFQIKEQVANVAVFFNAERLATGFTTQENVSLDVDILIDGRAIPPSDSENRFCTVGYPGFQYLKKGTLQNTVRREWGMECSGKKIELKPMEIIPSEELGRSYY